MEHARGPVGERVLACLVAPSGLIRVGRNSLGKPSAMLFWPLRATDWKRPNFLIFALFDPGLSPPPDLLQSPNSRVCLAYCEQALRQDFQRFLDRLPFRAILFSVLDSPGTVRVAHPLRRSLCSKQG